MLPARLLLGMLCASTVLARFPAQEGAAASPVTDDAARAAQRAVRLLELPERRTAAWLELLERRRTAVTPLVTAIDDPRPDVAVRAAWGGRDVVLGGIRPRRQGGLTAPGDVGLQDRTAVTRPVLAAGRPRSGTVESAGGARRRPEPAPLF